MSNAFSATLSYILSNIFGYVMQRVNLGPIIPSLPEIEVPVNLHRHKWLVAKLLDRVEVDYNADSPKA